MNDNPTSCDKIMYPILMCFHPKNNFIYKISTFLKYKIKKIKLSICFSSVTNNKPLTNGHLCYLLLLHVFLYLHDVDILLFPMKFKMVC